MKQKKYVLTAPMIILIFLGIYSCGTSKSQGSKHQYSENLFVYAKEALEEDMYRNIKGTVARLRAMMCGKYIYTYIKGNPEEDDFSVWRTADGLDSMMFYQIPIGDHRKIGYWIYHYQYLSSLPDDPVYEAFSQLVAINRDTIKEVYYEVPKNFKIDFNQKKEAIMKASSNVKWDKLNLAPDSTILYYARQSLIKFNATSNMARFSTPDLEIKYLKYHQVNIPNQITIEAELYDKNQQYLRMSTPIQLVKEAAIHPDMY